MIKKPLKYGMIAAMLLGLVGCASDDVDQYAPFRNQPPQKILDAGEKALADDDYSTAIADLEAMDAVHPFGPYSEQARLDIIYAYYKHDDTDAAIAATERYIRLYPSSAHVDYAYYMRGDR